ncbi:polysaccharide pyruvyl transferase family protein [Kocuria himachalensis]
MPDELVSGTREARKKVVVTNAVLSNTGDAAIYAGIIRSLVQEEFTGSEDVHVMDSDAPATKQLYPDWRVHQQVAMPSSHKHRMLRVLESKARYALCEIISQYPSKAPHIARILRLIGQTDMSKSLEVMIEADLVISSGGTYLVDHYNFTSRIAELKMAKALGAEVILWTQSMGPFEDVRSRRAMEDLSGVVSAVYVRDVPSREALRKVLPSLNKVYIAPDIAFVLAPPEKQQTTLPYGESIIVSVRNWSSSVSGGEFRFESYVHAMRSFARKLTENGATMRAMSTCQGVAAYNVDDSVVAREIFRDLPVEIDCEHHSPNQLLTEIQKCTLVVTTRMHLAILALAAGKPVIAIAYEFKTLELFKKLGFSENVCLIENVSAEWLIERTKEALINPKEFGLTSRRRAELAYEASMPARHLADKRESRARQRT